MAPKGLSATPEEIVLLLGKDLKARRLAMNLTQDAVAERAGISVSTLKRLEARGAGALKDAVSVAWSLGLRDAFAGIIGPPAPRSIDEVLEATTRAPRVRASGRRR